MKPRLSQEKVQSRQIETQNICKIQYGTRKEYEARLGNTRWRDSEVDNPFVEAEEDTCITDNASYSCPITSQLQVQPSEIR